MKFYGHKILVIGFVCSYLILEIYNGWKLFNFKTPQTPMFSASSFGVSGKLYNNSVIYSDGLGRW